MEQWETGIDGLKAAYEEWDKSKGASIDTWISLFAEECEIYSLADGSVGLGWTSSCVTQAGVRGYLEGLTADFELHFMHVEQYICQHDSIVALLRMEWKNRKTGRVVSGPKVDIWRIRDGRIVSFREFYDTLALSESIAMPTAA